ncbi:MAG: hypothetical protein QOI54_824 [Actinomycetota bacterium]|nr:hypothetical protein [Actinomycetota bacterium]
MTHDLSRKPRCPCCGLVVKSGFDPAEPVEELYVGLGRELDVIDESLGFVKGLRAESPDDEQAFHDIFHHLGHVKVHLPAAQLYAMAYWQHVIPGFVDVVGPFPDVPW